VTAYGRLSADAPNALLVAALEDPNAGVSNAARRQLASRSRRMDGAPLWELIERNPVAHVRHNAPMLLAGLGKWESIGWIIRACRIEDEPLARSARQSLSRWIQQFNRSQVRARSNRGSLSKRYLSKY
jgi:hypothetical protein